MRLPSFVREVHEGRDAVIPLGELGDIEADLRLAEAYDGVELQPEAEEGMAE